jgi:thiamine-phosphate pyrophosphorylase
MLERVYFISQQTATKMHLAGIEEALEAGCRLVQLRVKNEPEAAVLEQAKKTKDLCDRYNAKLIINDFPHVAKSVGAWGIHVGLQDMSPNAVRAIVGREMVVGGTANTFEHIQQRVQEGVDYIGLGPFRFTSTKEKLSPILGLEGFQRIMDKVSAAGIQLPIVAIGIQSVAVSGAILNADDKKEVVKQIDALYL